MVEIIDMHALCVVNGLVEKRKGLVMRETTTVLGIKRSVIDLVIMSSDLRNHIEQIHVDEKWIYVLTKNIKTKQTMNTVKVTIMLQIQH